MEELLLGLLLFFDELYIVDEQNVDVTVLDLEARNGIRAYRLYELVDEFLAGNVQYLEIRTFLRI